MSDNISCGTTDCECHNTNMPANCERSKKPNVSFCQKFTKEQPSEAKDMSDKPEKIEWKKETWGDCKGYVGQRRLFTLSKAESGGFTIHFKLWELKSDLTIYRLKQAKAKAEELLDEWLTRADLAKPSEWISVETELPERNSTVFLYDKMFDKCMVAKIDFEPERMDGDITHWQHLPSPPDKA